MLKSLFFFVVCVKFHTEEKFFESVASNSMIFFESKFWKKFMKIYKITRFLYMVQVRSQKYKGKYIYFFLSYFVNSQIWLNQVMDDRHIGYITKLNTIHTPGLEPFAEICICRNVFSKIWKIKAIIFTIYLL